MKTSRNLQETQRGVRKAQELLTEYWVLNTQLQQLFSQTAAQRAIGLVLPVLFAAQQPLDQIMLQGGQPVPAIRQQLDTFLSRLDAKVREAGAQPPPKGDSALIIRHPLVDPEKKSLSVFSDDQVLNAIAEQVHEAKGGVIVRAFSLLNTAEGEPVHADFQLFNNELVFHRGETLAQAIVDGRLSEPRIYSALVSLLRDEVGTKARKAGVMPRLAPLAGEGYVSSRGAVGEMTPEDLFANIAAVLRVGAPARVTALAADDTWTSGPLRVEFRIEPVA